jgi:UDP-N-acetylmuramoylalanine-D-glutamate ligase
MKTFLLRHTILLGFWLCSIAIIASDCVSNVDAKQYGKQIVITYQLAKSADVPVTYFSSKKEFYTEFPLKAGDSAVYVREGKIHLWHDDVEHEIMQADQMLLRGRHNLENLMTAIALTFEYASPEETPSLMADLVDWYNTAEKEGKLSPVELAALFHYR